MHPTRGSQCAFWHKSPVLQVNLVTFLPVAGLQVIVVHISGGVYDTDSTKQPSLVQVAVWHKSGAVQLQQD